MAQRPDMESERLYTQRVQGLLLALIERARTISASHSDSMRAIVADAWEELRLRPTEVSQQELDQLSTEMDRYAARKHFMDDLSEHAQQMLMNPFFARVDFREDGEMGEAEPIVIGLYSLSDEKGTDLLVHDWRAPVCSLYYDALPGRASYACPSGEISGEVTLKRQYRMEKGVLKYFADIGESIDDEMLLDMLGSASGQKMRQIVATIQAEQNAAIRQQNARVVSVVGGAGSGKTSVAMHRAAFLMYRQRETLDADHILILSPSTAFSEYVSGVLPELGEENIRARTLPDVIEKLLGKKVEKPYRQLEALLDNDNTLRRRSIHYKCGAGFERRLRAFADKFAKLGPAFADICLDDRVAIQADELKRMYQLEYSRLTPAQKLSRMQASMEARMEEWGEAFYKQYEAGFEGKYKGKELKLVCTMAVTQRLKPVRAALKAQLLLKGSDLLTMALEDAPAEVRTTYAENRAAGLTWWEDAVAEAYLALRLGFAEPDKTVYHLLIDEAQDYSETALAALHAYYPGARVTLLGDPRQRTCPGMDPCDPKRWGECFGDAEASIFRLNKCYRSTLQIAEYCNALMPEEEHVVPCGREGAEVTELPWSMPALKETLERYRAAGYKSIAVVTRTQPQADSISARLESVYKLEGGDADLHYKTSDDVVACYHQTKGLEFDAVAVVWQDVPMTDGERRRLYTACSRALHALTVLK